MASLEACSTKASVDEAVADGEADELVDAVDVQFFHDASAMRVYGVDAEV